MLIFHMSHLMTLSAGQNSSHNPVTASCLVGKSNTNITIIFNSITITNVVTKILVLAYLFVIFLYIKPETH